MKNWIAGAINPAHKGMLHRELGIPVGSKIPEARLKSAEMSGPPKEKKQAYLADRLRSMQGGK